jgi:hypothetical protein
MSDTELAATSDFYALEGVLPDADRARLPHGDPGVPPNEVARSPTITGNARRFPHHL